MILNPQMESIWGTLQGDYLIKRMISNDPRIRPSMSICGKWNYKWKLIIRKKAKIAYFDILAIFKKIYIFIFKCYLVSSTRWKIKTWRDCKECQNDIGTWLSWLGVEIWRIRWGQGLTLKNRSWLFDPFLWSNDKIGSYTSPSHGNNSMGIGTLIYLYWG